MRPDITLMGAVSGIEMACWDIVGKALDKPVYELMGGQVHERLRSYTYLYPEDHDEADVYMDPDTAAERAVEYVKEGFTAVKFDPGHIVSAVSTVDHEIGVDNVVFFVGDNMFADRIGPHTVVAFVACDLNR